MTRVNSKPVWFYTGNNALTYVSREDIYAGNNFPPSPASCIDARHLEIDQDALFDYLEQSRGHGRIDNLGAIDQHEINLLLQEHKHYVTREENPSIGDRRFNYGFNAGLIDFVSGAYVKTNSGWMDHSMRKVAEVTASKEHLKEIVSNYVRIIPTLDERFFKDADRKGVLIVEGKLIATKEGESWRLSDSQRLLYGDAIRALHHSSQEAILANSKVGFKTYHGVVNPESLVEKTKGEFHGFESYPFSVQGDGFYMCALNEAVRTYANTSSSERVSQKTELREVLGQDTSEDRIGVVHQCELSDNVSVWDCDFNLEYHSNSSDDKPSPFALKAVVEAFGDSLSEQMKNIIAYKVISMNQNAGTNFDNYMAVNELCSDLRNGDSRGEVRNLLGMFTQSLGHDAISISPPTKLDLKPLSDFILSVKDKTGEDYEFMTKNKVTSNPIIRSMESYLVKSANNSPAGIEKGHVILFNPNEDRCKVEKGLILKKHQQMIENKFFVSDAFFDKSGKSFDELTLNQLERFMNKELKKEK